jgi:hypothetical protein
MQLSEFRFTISLPALLFDNQETTFRQNFYMQRNGLPADIKILRNRIQIQRPVRHQVHNFPPGRIGYRLKYIPPDFH